MQREFWLERWQKQEIGFHQAEVNPWLPRCWPGLAVPADVAVFVPLCGKSLDMRWLAEQGHPVVGVELADTAVRAFFEEAGEVCRTERQRHLVRYCSATTSIYCGDFMQLTALELRGVGAVFDRAALIALPPRMRAQYADHLLRIVPEGTSMLLVTLEYEQSRVAGPPHSVPQAEVAALYGGRCEIDRIHAETTDLLPPKFHEAGIGEALEAVYRIVKTR